MALPDDDDNPGDSDEDPDPYLDFCQMECINVSPPSVNDTVIGDVNVNIVVSGLFNDNVSGHPLTLSFNDGEQTSFS